MPKQTPITLHAIAEPSRKRRGEAAEAAFLARATSLGFRICKPWGECERYDLVIDYGHGRFYRIQVKCTELFADRRYRVKNGGHSDAVYTPEETDFIAAHVTPLDLWYIVPIEAAGARKSLRFYPTEPAAATAASSPAKASWKNTKMPGASSTSPAASVAKKTPPPAAAAKPSPSAAKSAH